MMIRNIIKKYIIPIIILIIIGIISNNYIWYKLYSREKERLKQAIVPSLKDDYYTNQLILSKNENDDIFYEYEDILDNYYNSLKYSFIVDFPLVKQNPDYPNGCEVASATMLLKHFGISIDMKEYVDSYLPKDEVYEKDGLRYGPDPSKYYAGDPSDSSRGWGVFLPVIKSSLYTIFKNKLPEDKVGHIYTSDDKLPLEEYVQRGSPVLVWTTIDYSEAKDIYEWFSYDKSRTYTYPKNAHVVVIVGMDKDYYYINDPLKDEKAIKVSREKFDKSYDSMGRQALYIQITDIYEPKNTLDEYIVSKSEASVR